MRDIKILTRRSHLALIQAQMPIVPLLASQANEEIGLFTLTIVPTDTMGDKGKSPEHRTIVNSKSISSNLKSQWFDTIDDAIADGLGDIGIHSAKDIPPQIRSETKLMPIMDREDPRDVFISRDGISFVDLPLGSTIGTKSSRRKAQIMRMRPDLKVIDYQGNITKRVDKGNMKEKGVDGIILAAAGIHRLSRIIPDNIIKEMEYFDLKDMLPCVNQGIVVAQYREGDLDIERMLISRCRSRDYACWLSERTALEVMNVDCSKPVAIFSNLNENNDLVINLRAFSPDGINMLEFSMSSDINDAVGLGQRSGEQMIDLINTQGIWK